MYHAGLYRPFPWTSKAVRRINDSGFKAVLITNQSGVERGYFTAATVDEVHALLQNSLSATDASLDAIYYCPHRPETGCDCRKPKPGLLLRAGRDLKIDLPNSFMIGDRYIDVEAGRAAGVRSILLRTGDGLAEIAQHGQTSPIQPDFVADDLLDAVDAILSGRLG
jgi:D-glycero-D-manno-heptose 1,7-bisphosphate phosphatase